MRSFVPALLLLLAACTDTTQPEDGDEGELITTVVLTLTPTSGGEAITATWADPEADGDPEVDAILLADAEDYALSVAFLDELADPAVDITEEISDEAEEHQVFFTGDAVETDGILGHAYDDSDANGLPLGLVNTLETIAVGSGTLTVTLQHLPPEGDVVVKVAGLEDQVASGGVGAIGGDTDVQVSFAVTVE